MKFKITETEFGGLSDAFKAEYTKDGEDYTLTVEGGEDTGALKRAKDHEKTARLAVEAELATAKATIQTQADERIDMLKGVIPKGDVDALEASWQSKFDTQKSEADTALATSQGALNKILVENVASSLATEISTIPALLKGEIARRLTTEVKDGTPVTRVLDLEGKPSALTVDELKAEFIARPDLASVIIGSKATGSGATNANTENGGAKKFADMTGQERTDLFRSNKAEYMRIKALK